MLLDEAELWVDDAVFNWSDEMAAAYGITKAEAIGLIKLACERAEVSQD